LNKHNNIGFYQLFALFLVVYLITNTNLSIDNGPLSYAGDDCPFSMLLHCLGMEEVVADLLVATFHSSIFILSIQEDRIVHSIF